jgi:YHS domain-containing protein
MKWTVLTLAAALSCGAMLVGCEAKEETNVPSTPRAAPTTEESTDVTPPTTGPAATTRPATSASASLTIVNKYCAIETENKIDPEVTTVYNGKTIGFCCKDCIPKFEKEPAKYLATLK